MSKHIRYKKPKLKKNKYYSDNNDNPVFEDINLQSINDIFVRHLLNNDKLSLYNSIDGIENVSKFIAYLPCKNKNTIIFATGEVPNEKHQIAHMVEMSKLERCLLPDWGMALDNENHTAKQFLAGMSREIRVRAIQSLISKEEISYSKREEFSLLNSYWAHLVNSRLLAYGAKLETENVQPFGKFKSFEEVKEWEYYLAHATIKHWNLDRIEFEWNKRIDFISNWMETA